MKFVYSNYLWHKFSTKYFKETDLSDEIVTKSKQQLLTTSYFLHANEQKMQKKK